MERIERRSGRLYFGDTPCGSPDEAYRAFRTAYHGNLRNRSFRRLDARVRKERVHGLRIYLTNEYGDALDREFGNADTVDSRDKVITYILGITASSYCRIASAEKMPDTDDERFFRWLDWMMYHADRTMKTARLNDNSGRGSTNRKRYR